MKGKNKIVTLFLIATVSLLLAGHLLNPISDAGVTILLLWLGICGTLLIYGLEIGNVNLRNIRTVAGQSFNTPLKVIFILQFVFFVIPLCVLYMPGDRLKILAGICVLGLFYSTGLKFGDFVFKIKDTLLLKNICIGLGWGALVLAGTDTITEERALALFIFTSLQITIGSIVRDITDIDQDKIAGMRTLPMLIGPAKTIRIMHIANLLSFLPALLFSHKPAILILIILVIAWKWLILHNVKTEKDQSVWTQTYNILTCSLIFIIVLIQYSYERFR